MGLELGGNVDLRRPPRGVLHHQKELGDDLDDVAGLQDEVALPSGVAAAAAAAGAGGQTPGDVAVVVVRGGGVGGVARVTRLCQKLST